MNKNATKADFICKRESRKTVWLPTISSIFGVSSFKSFNLMRSLSLVSATAGMRLTQCNFSLPNLDEPSQDWNELTS